MVLLPPPPGHKVYKIDAVGMLPLAAPHGLSSAPADTVVEKRYRKLLMGVDLTKDFFFSYTYSLTHTLQARTHSRTRCRHVLQHMAHALTHAHTAGTYHGTWHTRSPMHTLQARTAAHATHIAEMPHVPQHMPHIPQHMPHELQHASYTYTSIHTDWVIRVLIGPFIRP